MFSKIIAVVAFASVAFALPKSGGQQPVSYYAAQCADDQTISCCNSESTLIGLNCIPINVITIPLTQACGGSNVATCCSNGPTEASNSPPNTRYNSNPTQGQLNIAIQCIPITI